MASNGVVAAVTAHIGGLTAATFASTYGTGATPAQVGRACGYPGKASSGLRAYVARQHAAGTAQQGVTRYPPLSYAQWCKVLGLAQRAHSTQATPKQQAQASTAVRGLWAAARKGGKQAKQQAQQQATKPASKPAAKA